MPIIDAHLHLGDRPWFHLSAQSLGGSNSLPAILETLARLDIRAAVAMGSGEPLTGSPSNCLMDLDGVFPDQSCPGPLWTCAGVHYDSLALQPRPTLEHLRRCAALPHVAGFKLYPGYQHFYVSDPALEPLYRLAEEFDLPVVIHTGDTVTPGGKVKYSHPLTVDDAAVDHPRVRFVLAHMGYPWFADAAEVVYKNPNVYADLSGLASGRFRAFAFAIQNRPMLEHLTLWLGAAGWEKLLYGTDWPLVDMGDYLELMRWIIPEQHREYVFYHNALQVFPRIAAALGQN